LRPQPKSFNGKPKATAFPTGADAFGLPLNEMRAGRAHFDCLQYEGRPMVFSYFNLEKL
jgi:hypothetical protein